MTPSILVPLDGSAHALVALPVARGLAELAGEVLHLVYVSPDVTAPSEVLDRLGLSARDLRGSVLDAKAGEPGAGIVRAARESRCVFIVMCTHTALPRPHQTLGRTARAVLEGAPCPVVLVRPERGLVPCALRRILLPHDGTPTTSAAIRPAAELARRAGAELAVLHVAVPRACEPVERGSLTAPRYLDQPQHEWPSWVGEFLERLAGVCPLDASKVRMALAHGSPGEEVLRFASEHGADLIVLAWRGEWEGRHAATVKAVLRQALCPMMVIRAEG